MTLFNDDIDTNDSTLTYDQLVEKYKDNNGIVKAVEHKDQFIEQLKTEQARLRADLDTRIKYEEFLDRMNSLQSGDNKKGAPSPDDDTSDNKTHVIPTTSLQDVEKLLEQRDAKRLQDENLAQVERQLAQTLGPNYGSKLKQQAADLGMSENDLINVAKQNPKAFFKLVDIGNKTEQSFTPPPRNMFNTEFKPSGGTPGQKTFSYYEEIRKTKPNEYWQPRIQNEMMKALETQGDAFYL